MSNAQENLVVATRICQVSGLRTLMQVKQSVDW